jgi:hypothetical protein
VESSEPTKSASGGQTKDVVNNLVSGAGPTTQMESLRVRQPQVTAAQNGPDARDEQTTFFDVMGRSVWQMDGAITDPDRVLRYWAYSHASGSVTRSIEDVNTAQTQDFTGLPLNWTTPPGSTHGLHLKSDSIVDGLGRTTKLTDPDGNVTHTVYIDKDHEVRTYPGWQTSTKLPTGPILVTRLDRANPDSFTESYTMSQIPTLNAVNEPKGDEVPANLLSLSRTLTSKGGQTTLTAWGAWSSNPSEPVPAWSPPRPMSTMARSQIRDWPELATAI